MADMILIVDDDLESVKLIGLMLQRRGYEITAAQDGKQALIKAETEKPDLIILDVMMPDMDGYEVCQQLRSNPQTAQVPVLMFTAKTLVGDKVAGFQSGADDYLTKPIHPAELVSRVEALLEREETAPTEARGRSRARVIGVMGAKGGVGASTLVVNLALATLQVQDDGAEREGSPEVGIADLRLGSGSVALLLGQAPQAGLETLMALDADTLSAEIVEKQVLTHVSGLHYLPTLPHSEGGRSNLPVPQTNALLTWLSAGVDYLFLDLGSALDEATRHAITSCDVVLVVVEPERLCLALARPLLERIRSLEPAPNDLRVVLVEHVADDPAQIQAGAEELSGYEIAGVVGAAPALMRLAVEKGQPVILMQPGSEIAAQLRELSQSLLA